MVKTIVNTVLIILVLAGVFFFAIQMWEGRQKSTPEVGEMEQPTETINTIRQVGVQPSGDGAVVQISEVATSNYDVTTLSDGPGILVDIASANVAMLQSSLFNPHPLVRRVQASQTDVAGSPHARVRIEFSEAARHTARLQGNALYIDVMPEKKEEEMPTEMAKEESIKTESAPPVMEKPKPKPVAPKVVSKPKPKPKPVVKAKPKPKPKPKPAPKVAAPAPPDDDDELLKELGLDDEASMPPAVVSGGDDLGGMIDEGPGLEVGGMEEASAPAVEEVIPSGDDNPGLDQLFGEESGGIDDLLPVEDIPEEVPEQKVASLPDSSGVFETSKITGNLPAVTNLDIQNVGGGGTTVSIAREAQTPYKVFRMRNPTRVVVEFKDMVSQVQENYGAFPGTIIKKVTIQQYQGPNGAMVRLMFFIDGPPPEQRPVVQNEGGSFVMTIQ